MFHKPHIQLPTLRLSANIALLTLLTQVMAAALFYRERMLFIDAAGVVFRAINTETLLIPENRYGCILTQLIPYLGVKCNLPLDAILLAYSVSFQLFYFLIGFMLVYVFRQYGLAILLTLYYTLFSSDVFFWPNSEVHQGTAWMFLWVAVAFCMQQKPYVKWVQVLLFLILGALTLSSHPINILSTWFLWIFLWINRSLPIGSKKDRLFFTLLIALLTLTKILLSLHQSYDTRVLQHSLNNPVQQFVGNFPNSVLLIFTHYLVTNYWIAWVVIAGGAYALLAARKVLVLIFIALATIGFLLLLSVVFPGHTYPANDLFYLEGEWLSLAIILGCPFVFYFLPRLRPVRAATLLILIFSVRLGYMKASAVKFTQRIAHMERLLQQMRNENVGKLMLLNKQSVLDDKFLIDIALPHETILLSKLDGDMPQKTIVVNYQSGFQHVTAAGVNNMIDFFGPLPYRLNQRYFIIDTSSFYEFRDYYRFVK